MKRVINRIVIHCSATREGKNYTSDDIRRWHKGQGWNDIGYHYVVTISGEIEKGRDEASIGAHVRGHNSDSIGVCYVGGLDHNGKPKDTRTEPQKAALIKLLRDLKRRYPKAVILGHRDLSPDKNGDGVISRGEWVKDCPCFDAAKEYKDL